jgi:hypothetical protein
MNHETDATVQPDGSVVLSNLPFAAGDKVHVVVTPTASPANIVAWESLRGTLLKYDAPFEPAAPLDNWESLQ